MTALVHPHQSRLTSAGASLALGALMLHPRGSLLALPGLAWIPLALALQLGRQDEARQLNDSATAIERRRSTTGSSLRRRPEPRVVRR